MNIVNATPLFDRHLATRGQVAQLIETIGRPSFATTIMEVINRFLPVAHYAALIQDGKSGVQIIAAASRSCDETSATIAQVYARQYFRSDPGRQATFRISADQHVALTHLKSRDISHSSYRRECYDKPGIIERLSVSCKRNDCVNSLNFYRTHEEGPFEATDYDIAIETTALLLPFIIRHRTMNASPVANRVETLTRFTTRLQGLPSRLAQREIEVCARALIGMSVEATALDLGIRPTSVTTYRQRAYQKLGISSQNELFALVLH